MNKQAVTLILYVVAIVIVGYLVYSFLKSQGLITQQFPTSTAATSTCPRGPEYRINFWEKCDPNYREEKDWLPFNGSDCKCLSGQ